MTKVFHKLFYHAVWTTHLRQSLITENFMWQDGVGVLSFGEKDIPSVLRYIRNQKEHHRANTINAMMEQIVDDEE